MPRVAIVTGASQGIGAAIATRLARDGVHIVLCARDAEKLAGVVATIAASGGSAEFLALDLRLPESAQRLVEAAGRIDILVNNAGATRRGEFTELTDAEWEDGFALKFFGAMRLTRAAWPALKAGGGSVVFVAGVGGRTPGRQFAIGGSVNAALLSLTKALAELGTEDGVQVNAINPGPVRTERWRKRIETFAREGGLNPETAEREYVRAAGIRRVGEPDDVANLVSFVTSPAGSLLHGSLIDIDGGETRTI
jgi:NAD(P)-dependent dehydrogenase (short-subunit alcohol dehydrogenase family)